MDNDNNVQGDVYTTSRGLKLRLKMVPSFIIYDATRRLKEPRPPRTFNEDKGREEENPLDPEYLQALEEYEQKTNSLSMDTYLVLGTAVVPPLPDDILPVESEDWSQPLVEDLGLDIPQSGRARYKAWLKYHALGDMDNRHLIRAVMVFSGVTFEEDVEAAMRSFRSNEGRGTSTELSSSETSTPEHRNGDTVGEGAGDRGEGSGDIRELQLPAVGSSPSDGEGAVDSPLQAPSPD